MKLEQRLSNLQTSGIMESNSFSIEQSPIMFDILSSKLYSDPIKAVIRELLCNALDIHRMTGTTEPFTITLPSALDPFWKVRDFGSGLSPENVRYLYTSYGKSLKRHSNDLIGGLGLGSKSPFAVGPTFSVESWFEGKYSSYSCVIEDGYPKIYVLTKPEDTDEPSGLRITVPVKDNNFNVWLNKTVEILKWFPENSWKCPQVLRQLESIPSHKIIKTRVDLKKSGCWFNNGFNDAVLVDSVLYNLDKKQLGFSIRNACFIKAPIGSVTIAPNRESLVYDEKTVRFLKNLYEDTVKETIDGYVKDFRNAPTKWLKRVAYKKFKDDYPYEESFRNIFIKTIGDDWKKLAEFASAYDIKQPIKGITKKYFVDYVTDNSLRLVEPRNSRHNQNFIRLFDGKGTFLIIRNEIPTTLNELRQAIRLAKEFWNFNLAYIIGGPDAEKLLDDEFGGVPRVYLSDILKGYRIWKKECERLGLNQKKDPDAKRVKQPVKPVVEKIKTLLKNGHLKEISPDISKESGFYCITNRNEIEGLDKELRSVVLGSPTGTSLVNSFLKHFVEPSVYESIEHICVFPKSAEHLAPKNNTKWVSVAEVINKGFSDYVIKNGVGKTLEDDVSIQATLSSTVDYPFYLKTNRCKELLSLIHRFNIGLDPSWDITQLKLYLEYYDEALKKFNTYNSLVKTPKILPTTKSDSSSKKINEIRILVNNIVDKYPLIVFNGSNINFSLETKKHIEDYISWVNSRTLSSCPEKKITKS